MFSSARLRWVFLGVAVVVCLVVGQRVGQASQNVIHVNTVLDHAADACVSTSLGDCTLREAILVANATTGADKIDFDPTVFSAGGTPIELDTDLPYAEVSEGIEIDATGTPVTIQPCDLCGATFGLVFFTSGTDTARDVTVRGVSATGFFRDGIQVCGGLDEDLGDCFAPVSSVVIENGSVYENSNVGLQILGDDISDVTVSGVEANGNTVGGIVVRAYGPLTNIQVNDGTTANSNFQFGMKFTGAEGVDGVSVTGGSANGNQEGAGLFVHGDGTTRDVSVSSFTANGNDGSGVSLTSTGGSMPGTAVDDVTAHDNNGQGIEVNSSAGLGATITGSSVANDVLGIYARGGLGIGGVEISGNTLDDNKVGISAETGGQALGLKIEDNTVTNSTNYGIDYSAGSDSSNNFIRRNTLTGNGWGIYLSGNAAATISRNIIHDNDQLGIDLVAPGDPVSGVTLNDPGDADTGPNGLLNYPEWTFAVGYSEAEGTACANCLVELFSSDDDPSGHGEGEQFIMDTTADDEGHFSIDLCPLNPPAGTLLTATATDADGNTSEFSENYETLELVGCPTSTPSPTPTPTHSPTPTPSPTAAPGHKQGDLNCDGKIDGLDALIAILAKFGLAAPTGGCPNVGEGSPKFGDVNCDGTVDEMDALALLAFKAGATALPQQEPCTNIGSALPD